MSAHGCTSRVETAGLRISKAISQKNPSPTPPPSADPASAQPPGGSPAGPGWAPAQTSAHGLQMAANSQLVLTPLQGEANLQEQ